MARKSIGINLDDNDMNSLNDNFVELYDGVNRVTSDKGISTNLLADGAVNYRVLADGAVRPQHIVQNGVRELQLAGNSVSTVKVQDGAITSPKIMDSSITERTLNTFINNRIYNTNYKIGVNIGSAYDNGNFLDLYINDLRIFISSGTTLFSITNQEFRLERNTTIYVDMSELTPKIVKSTAPPQSGTEFGTGGFFDDRKILLLSNAYGTLMGALADSFKNAVAKTLNEKVLAKKEGDNYLVYVQSKANPKRYTQFFIEHKELDYTDGDKYSNVKVNTLNGAKAVTRNMDNTFTSGTDIVHGGAWDCAIREVNTSDGIGGIAHGDEIQNFFKVKIDGGISDIPSTLTHYESVEFVAGSNLYRDSQTFPDNQKLATHFKSFKFTGDGLTMESSVKFLRDATLNYMYLGMCPINKQFTDKAYSDVDVIENDLTKTAPIHQEKSSVNVINVYGSTASVNVEVLERVTDLSENTRIEEVSYNKIYFDLADNNEIAKEGNIYRLKTQFEISLL
ncbi:hypothetical protein AALF85_02685 [Jeotgalicoccus halotolerans]|uniref:hypothetical protein n=1 Tax=Jeotgalicoccus halotolerans TaxID=157227 RepID=UPI003516FB7C